MDIANIIVWVIVGAIGGWLGGLVMRANVGPIGTIIIGIVGGVIGGFILNAVGIGATVTGLNLPSIVVAFVGAVILIALVRLLRRV